MAMVVPDSALHLTSPAVVCIPTGEAGRSATTTNRRGNRSSTTPSSYRPLSNGCSSGLPAGRGQRRTRAGGGRRYRGDRRGITPNPDLNIADGVDCSDDATPDLSDEMTTVPRWPASRPPSTTASESWEPPQAPVCTTSRLRRRRQRRPLEHTLWPRLGARPPQRDQRGEHELRRHQDVTNDNDCGLKSDDPFHMAICQAYAEGITLVAGSGNDGIQDHSGPGASGLPRGDHRRRLPGHRRSARGPWVRLW